ncbi:protein SUPPRESSOR OF QUENCHING 1, chloroplastic isoform X6 [Oryza sativa Japonica Group]|uniref:protein SUPPRESSOR OF QUENCHING 1, chloroplastic isoform X6 n=1 Tax=Oryza sativa subsp. japonica TaxID=39947 RepID=UPI00077551F1|nr:protein SUPPRESSOR OF QUENCHING 1, chloroplastic isoform X8 [Oryza sativa Japonica Group]
MARHLAPPGSFHRLLASRHYPPSSPAPPPRPLLLLPKTLIPPAAAAMEFPRRGRRDVAAASAPASSSPETEVAPGAWGKVSAVLFDMDGVLCNSEELSRLAGVDLFAEMGVDVTGDDFVPYMGTGEANFLGGVAKLKGVKDFNAESAKKRFFEIYLDKYAKPNAGIGFPGALDLVTECKNAGLKVAVASSADRIKVDANLAAAGLPLSLFDAIVSADAFENLKPAPDIFLAASKTLGVDTDECIVIEDALAGVQAAKAAEMRCIAVMTTLEEDALQQASPSLIRKNIGDISIRDILYGGSNAYHNERTENTENISSLKPSTEILNGATNAESAPSTNSASSIDDSREGLVGSRRNILRYGSLGIAVSCLIYTTRNWKAMQFVSPKGLLNYFTGGNSSIFASNEGEQLTSRVQQIKKYLADFETGGSATCVPEFPRKLDWLNTAPLQFGRDLKGRVVLLDFWTYCCINCMHVLPDLEFIEKKYKDKPFTVVGVHSAKFDNEKDLEAIRNAVLRYNITHPVVNDGDMYLWRELGVNSWPTFVVIGPNGKVLAQISGEGHRKDLDDVVGAALEFYEENKLLQNSSLPLALEKDKDSRLLASPLKFPGKLAIDVLNNRLFISDSNHNRIVVTNLEGEFICQIGSSEEGLLDGTFDTASFNRPQGLAYNSKKNILYVADTENHALREINFVSETVKTLAGNGTKGSDYRGGGQGTNQVLNSPWDVCYDPSKETLYIAMAGQHQIWKHNTLDGVTEVLSGDGYERNLNGSSSTRTSFAQPSGISLAPGISELQELIVADSESSSIRVVNLKSGGSRSLAGGDPMIPENLFRFGDHDGTGSDVLLQHPLGVVYASDNQIYVADSYNHKIKRLDPVTRKVTTIAGTGRAGYKDGPALSAQLSEPAGLVEVGDGRLLVADTNNSTIRYIVLNEKGAEVRTLDLIGVQPPSPKPKTLKRLRRRLSADTDVINIDGGSSIEGYLSLAISVPDGYHFSKEARSKFDVDIEPADAIEIEPVNGFLNSGQASLKYRRKSSSSSTGRINCKVYYCKEDEVCLYQSVAFDVKFREEAVPSPAQITLSYSVVPRDTSSSAQLIAAGKNGKV